MPAVNKSGESRGCKSAGGLPGKYYVQLCDYPHTRRNCRKNPENCLGRFLPESRSARAKQKGMESQAVPSITKIRESGSVHVARMPGSVHVAGKAGAAQRTSFRKPGKYRRLCKTGQPGDELRPLFRKTTKRSGELPGADDVLFPESRLAGSRENTMSKYAIIKAPGETARKIPENCRGRFLPESRLARKAKRK